MTPVILAILWTQQRRSFVLGHTPRSAVQKPDAPSPKAKSGAMVSHRLFRLLIQATKRTTPAVHVLTGPIHDTKNILFCVFVCSNNYQHTQAIIVQARVEVDTLRSEINITLLC